LTSTNNGQYIGSKHHLDDADASTEIALIYMPKRPAVKYFEAAFSTTSKAALVLVERCKNDFVSIDL
jgi:hypothetical protein|tara:strand:- start:206 stop:406 length:201 start_codon:yes stop_codon:yes gene_type:complete